MSKGQGWKSSVTAFRNTSCQHARKVKNTASTSMSRLVSWAKRRRWADRSTSSPSSKSYEASLRFCTLNLPRHNILSREEACFIVVPCGVSLAPSDCISLSPVPILQNCLTSFNYYINVIMSCFTLYDIHIWYSLKS